ncbi:zinc ribbon domain-containing protein [Halobaculum sp. WSA2]|uniref:Zinc ribbon domain-containing protein n=1 Tax=Halobaculum saliterrae TaxID=2073113 RepID=A0A6B0SQJ0_9EURY|nr:zinc ribbon domain-containing protein [Halobaculum saliterrae]MXR41188.1 zinc ribbon domain-containing protein [Halobaculum saliterrae]
MDIPRLGGPTGRKRPWLAVLLALAVTGLGHAYLRRWLRGFAWFAATFAAVLLLVPPDVIEALNTASPIANPVEALPPVLVVVASAVDAYFLARETHEHAGVNRPSTAAVADDVDGVDGAPRTGAARGAADAGGRGTTAGAVEAPACPNCGKDLDADLDFCPWCTTRLDWGDPGGSDATRDGDGRNGSNP